MFCQECGTKITERKCPKCGTELKDEDFKSVLNDIFKSRPPTFFTKEERENVLNELYLDSPMNYPNLTESDKNILRHIFIDAYNNKRFPSQILKIIRTEIQGITREQAIKISNTERARGLTLLNYVEALTQRNAKSFTVRVSSEGCKLCHETYEGKVFDICQRKMLPPFHDECTCIAQFSRDPVK